MKPTSRRTAMWTLFAASIAIAGVVSYWASPHPDGLERTMEDHGLLPAEGEGHAATEPGEAAPPAGGPLADYQVAGVGNPFLSNALAGILGSLLVLGVVVLAGYALTRLRRTAAAHASPGGR